MGENLLKQSKHKGKRRHFILWREKSVRIRCFLCLFLRLDSDGPIDENTSVFSPFVSFCFYQTYSKSTPRQGVRTDVHVHRKNPV